MTALPEEVQVPTTIPPLPPARWVGGLSQQLPLPFMPEVAVQSGSLPSLAQALEKVSEHRRPRGFKAHQPPVLLIPTLLLLIAAVMCGRRGYGSIAEWGAQCSREQPEVLDAFGFGRDRRPRTPVAATFFRLLRDMKLREFQRALMGWLEEVARALQVTLPEREKLAIPEEKVAIPEDQIAVDGKTVRGASARRERGKGQLGQRGGPRPDPLGTLHLVAAYAPALRVVLDQVASEGKGQELAAVKLLLGQLPLKGRIITADALATQREVCETVMAGKGYYLLPVDRNQPALLADLQEAFSPCAAAGPREDDRAAYR